MLRNYYVTATSQYPPLSGHLVTLQPDSICGKIDSGAQKEEDLLRPPGLACKDTVFVTISILWRTRHVEKNKSGIMGSIYNNFI